MSEFTNVETVAYECIRCGECSVQFALNSNFYRQRKEDGQRFSCPNGHQVRYCDSNADHLRKVRSQLAHEREQHEAAKAENERLKRRVAKGVCPCCKRSFQNLREHIATKHPKFANRV